MDPYAMRSLANDRYQAIVADADAARAMGLGGNCPRGAKGRTPGKDELRVSRVVSASVSAILRCRWGDAERAMAGLGLGEVARGAPNAVMALLTRLTNRGGHHDRTGTTPGGDLETGSQAWAVMTASEALAEWAERVPVRGTSTAVDFLPAAMIPPASQVVVQMCEKAATLGDDERDLLCLALALDARARGDRILASFVLGHMSEVVHAPAGETGSAGDRRILSTAARAATGLGHLTMGDELTGREILLGVVQSARAPEMPLVHGLVDAELTRLDRESGDDAGALRWRDRTLQFSRQYECPLPAMAIGAAV